MSFRKLLVVSLAAAAVVAFAAPSLGQRVTVKATDDILFKPAVKTIHKGDKVVWKNAASIAHTVSAYGGSWKFNKTLQPGDKVTRKFPDKGTFTYRCTVVGHSYIYEGKCSGMCGRIKVRR